MASMNLSHHDYAIAWVCALPLEMAAAKAMLEERHKPLPQSPGDNNVYKLGKLSGHNIVIACLPAGVYGITSAATVLSQMLLTFQSLKFALMVGIGGGVPSKRADIRLGDVVVSVPTGSSSGVIQYDFGKTLAGGYFQRTGALNSPPQVLLKAVSNLSSDAMIGETDINGTISNILSMNERLRQSFSRPSRDWLFDAQYTHPNTYPDCSECDPSKLVSRVSRISHEPLIHYGLIASANQVMKDAKTRDSVAQDLDILCFEMEAAGLMNQIPCLVIRGICDYCDSHKNKEWQGYAALAAAVYSRHLLAVVPPQENDSHIRYATLARQNEKLRTRQMEVLKKLHVSQYRDQKDRNPDRIPGTCEWFTSNPIFRAWESSQTSRMLWVSANPGCGKSVLAKYLADSVLTHGASRAVGYFFFKDDFEDQRSITNALCCILQQVFHLKRDLLTETVLERFEMNERVTSSFSELWNILITSANEKHAGEIVVLLDALDECEQQGCAQLMEALHRLYTDKSQRSFNLKFLITSRLYSRIRQRFQPLKIPGQPVIHLSGESDIEMMKISREIDLFIEAKVKDVQSRLQLTDHEHGILLQRLTCVPNRTYLWVYLTLDLFKDKDDIDERGIIEATSNLPQSVDEAYERILSRSTDSIKARQLLFLVVGALRPLSLQEMNFALALRKDHRSHDDVTLGPENRLREMIPAICGLFVAIIDSKIYLLHQTAREFLVKGAQEQIADVVKQSFKWRHSLHLPDSHRILAKICVQYLLILDFEEAQSFAQGRRSGPGDPVFLDYSAIFWTTHLLESNMEMDSMVPALNIICDASTIRCQAWLRIYWASLSTDFPTGFTTLMVTSYFGLTHFTKHWIKMNEIDLDAKDDVYGRSALSWAAGNGHSAIVEVLTQRSWKTLLRKRWTFVDSADKHNRTALSWAILSGYEETARVLLRAGAAIDLADDIGGTPLYYAVLSESRGLLQLLMKRGTQIQSKESIQNELLLSAAKKGHEPVVRMLLEQGVDVDSKDTEYGRTLLSWAAGNGHASLVKLLLVRGANLESKDSQHGRTPLSWAAGNGHFSLVKLLLERGANLESKDSQYGWTPLSWAAENGHSTLSWLLLGGVGLEARVHVQKFRNIVGAITILQAPVPVDALAHIHSVSPQDILDQLQSLNSLRSILTMPKDPNGLIRFLHWHFQDLLKTATTPWVDKNVMHSTIAAQCLHIMNSSLEENICDLPSYAIECQDIKNETIDRCLPKDLQYSCCHWVYHLDRSNEPVGDAVVSFLEDHFLHWLEAMSIMGAKGTTLDILNKLSGIKTSHPKLSELLGDAQQFIHRNKACSAPLQFYYSGIAFSRGTSMFRRMFGDKSLRRTAALPIIKKSWSIQLQMRQGQLEDIYSMIFSPEGQMLASDSGNRNIWLWDIKSGKKLKFLKGHSGWVNFVIFSPDSQMLASCSNDKTVRLWDTRSGQELQTLRGHSDSVNSVAFSPDSQMLASGSGDKTIQLWDIKSGKQLQTFEGHLDLIISVTFSPDGQMLASSSEDETIRLWDIKSGKQLQTLQGHSDFIISVAFSPDSQMLASGSADYTVRLWDTKTGTLQKLLRTKTRARSLEFSTHGRYLHTNSDSFELQPCASSSSQPVPDESWPRVSLIAEWVAIGGVKVLWLPLEYRKPWYLTIKDGALVLGYRDGWVCILNFHEKYSPMR